MQPITCPQCNHSLAAETDECPHCGQLLCVGCGAPLDEDDTVCEACGAEYGLYCSACGEEIAGDDVRCPRCGANLNEDEDLAPAPDTINAPLNLVLPSRYTGQCPKCDTPLFLEDGFCNECGATFCTRCSGLVNEDDERCPHCDTPLFFACPMCAFELTTGTDQCPNCNTLIPNYCTGCGAALTPESEYCPQCATAVTVIVRQSARIIHSLKIGEQLVQVAACPGCGGRLHIHEGRCHACGYRICTSCQISLQPDEEVCPRCGPRQTQIVFAPEPKRHCPTCGQPLEPQSDVCVQCGQLFCPDCLAAVDDEAIQCPRCSVVFEFECPECGTAVSAEAEVCPHCATVFED